MRIAIVTNAIYDSIPEYMRLSNESKRRYCERRGIDWICTCDNPHPDSHPVWCKPTVMMRALWGRDWVVWMDADALITNFDKDISAVLSDADSDVVMQRDVNGWNAGVFAVRRFEPLQMMEALRHEYVRGFKEQQALSDLIRDGKVSCQEPPREFGWNEYIPALYRRNTDRNLWNENSWCLHLPAVSDSERLNIFKELVK